MPKKNIFLLLLAAGLAVVYAVYFTDWFAPKTFSVFHTYRALRTARAVPARGGPMPQLMFVLNYKLKLTEIRVVARDAWLTNKNAALLWHLVTTSNSIPVKAFTYGQNLPGLHPSIPGTHADPLATNVVYRLLVAAGKYEAEHDFELK